MSEQELIEVEKDIGSDSTEIKISKGTAAFDSRNKKSFIKRFIGGIIPAKGDSVFEIIRKTILIISIITAVTCAVIIIMDFGTAEIQVKHDEKLVELKEQIELTGNIPLDVETVEQIKEEVPEILDKYVAFYNINKHLVGWVKIDGTVLDYPVVQTKDNEYYLTRDFEKADSKFGTIFADYHIKLKNGSKPNNTVLYGHNISNGSYFASITNYFPRKYGSLNYYIEHPTVTFDTIYEEGTYKIFAGIFINTDPDDNNGEVYEYYKKRSFKNKAAFYDFAQNIMDRSVFYTDVDLEYGDEILTLSTCYYPMGKDVDSRFVIFARRVREGEDPTVDTSAAYINPSPLYFAKYNRNLGISWAGRNWDTTLVKGLDEFLAETEE